MILPRILSYPGNSHYLSSLTCHHFKNFLLINLIVDTFNTGKTYCYFFVPIIVTKTAHCLSIMGLQKAI